ncbi:NAD-dependent protein deacetylase sirtuin-3-like [Anneissia japonica]|uniref:NAD-dependent protein deacetylase sirtuin-3-like n=1 Tax=Anneissia japonica TaxID=1529436 RepID=UPI00142554FA|nr:NAD-dependent protein deacetylase sirtuin-3-like [Anneissia japonica]XP_033112299.1 NAD-dependent protein deacetylase sirtuin-3-like [Anneissia japonica]
MVRLFATLSSTMKRNVGNSMKKKSSRGSKSQKESAVERPKAGLATDISAGGIHSSASSSSSNNVNPKRNTRQKAGPKKSSTSLEKSFEKLSLREKSTSTRSSSSSAKYTCKTLEDVARWILNKRSKNIVVMAGAGISTPSGILDFRTPGTGLYDNLQQYQIPYPEAIFDIDYFHNDPRPFFTLARELYPGNFKPNYVHYFVRMLHEKGLLLRMYTQNIDGLERLAGIPPVKLVEAHGTFSTASCVRCGMKTNSDNIKATILSGNIPKCKSCSGIVKPDIVFFGEDLPKQFFYYLKDFPQCDLLIVMGTSLQVQPFAGIVDSVRSNIPRLLINREVVEPFASKKRFNDVSNEGDMVEGVRKFAQVLGWKESMEDLILECEKKLEKHSEKDKTTSMEKLKCNENSNNGTRPKPPKGAISDTKSSGRLSHTSTRSIHTSIRHIMSDAALNVRGKSQLRGAGNVCMPQFVGKELCSCQNKGSSSSEESSISEKNSSSGDG